MDNPLHCCPNCGHSWNDHDLTSGLCTHIVSRGLRRGGDGELYNVPIKCSCKALRKEPRKV